MSLWIRHFSKAQGLLFSKQVFWKIRFLSPHCANSIFKNPEFIAQHCIFFFLTFMFNLVVEFLVAFCQTFAKISYFHSSLKSRAGVQLHSENMGRFIVHLQILSKAVSMKTRLKIGLQSMSASCLGVVYVLCSKIQIICLETELSTEALASISLGIKP